MPEATRTVLRPDPGTETELYRNAIARLIRSIQDKTEETCATIADNIGVEAKTISNALNKRGNLSPIFVQRLRHYYGLEHLDSYGRFFGARMAPLEAQDIDALPSLTASVHRLAVAQSPDSEGGQAITHRELLSMLPELRSAVQALNSLIGRAERVAA